MDQTTVGRRRINGGLTLTGIGGLVSFCIDAAGFGAAVRAYLE